MPGRTVVHRICDAVRGVGLGFRGDRNFLVHLPMAGLVLIAAMVLGCERWEWCLLVVCVGLVVAAELLNGALETMFHALDDAAKARVTGCLDLAAGGVLVSAATACIVGLIVFVPKLFAIVK